MKKQTEMVYIGKGFCPICEEEVVFSAAYAWFRDHLICSGCGSVPRERALMRVIAECFPNYKKLTIHEASPIERGAALKLKRECPNYSTSHYFKNVRFGQIDKRTGYRCESLEALTYKDDSFDLFVTQDVMEHLFNPDLAFKEIARVLKPGGAHIFTVPIMNKHKRSQVWASQNEQKETVFHHPAEYHGNPIDKEGSLVTMHWGYDIVSYISKVSEMSSTIIVIDDLTQGIKAEYIDVVVSWCPEVQM